MLSWKKFSFPTYVPRILSHVFSSAEMGKGVGAIEGLRVERRKKGLFSNLHILYCTKD